MCSHKHLNYLAHWLASSRSQRNVRLCSCSEKSQWTNRPLDVLTLPITRPDTPSIDINAKTINITAPVDSGCLSGGGKNREKGTCCMRWGTGVQEAVEHVTVFCQPEGILAGTLPCFVHWRAPYKAHYHILSNRKDTSEGTLLLFVHWKGTTEDTSSGYIYHWGIQQGTQLFFCDIRVAGGWVLPQHSFNFFSIVAPW